MMQWAHAQSTAGGTKRGAAERHGGSGLGMLRWRGRRMQTCLCTANTHTFAIFCRLLLTIRSGDHSCSAVCMVKVVLNHSMWLS